MTDKSLNVSIQKGDRDGQWIMAASSRDRVDDTIAPEAFEKAIKQIGGKLIALWQHDSDRPVGYWENLKHDAGKLIGDLKIAGTNLGMMIKQLLADDVPLGASIGFRSLDHEPNKVGGIHFKQIELLETSIVSVPANPAAMQIAKSCGIDFKTAFAPSKCAKAPHAKSGIHPMINTAKRDLEQIRRVMGKQS